MLCMSYQRMSVLLVVQIVSIGCWRCSLGGAFVHEVGVGSMIFVVNM